MVTGKQRLFCVASSLSCLALSGAAHAGDEGGQTRKRPNILWLTSEDNNVTWLGCYGNKNATTPTLDKLAQEGFQYMNAYAAAPVCAPSRSTWITGINAISMGTQNMRSRYEIPHDKIKYYPDVLRANGYYCGNYPKTDYNIGGRSDKACWDNPGPVDWQALKDHQPFFQVINCFKSHESQAKFGINNTRHLPGDVTLRKYHPDDPTIRKNYARYEDCVENMDTFEAEQLKALKEAGLADNTIVIYCSDHGGVLPRSKRFLFDSGLHSPLIIRIPEKFKSLWPAEKPGTKVYRLVSFLDMPKTWLSITGCKPPETMQGRIFLGPDAEPEPEFVFSFRGRMDERVDNQRAVHDKRFLYVRNYMPFVPWGQKLEYMWGMPAYRAWDACYKAGKTDAVTGRFFTPKKRDELYDTTKDPDNVNNLIDNPEYKDAVEKMRAALRKWQLGIYDAGLMPESEIVRMARANDTTIYEMVRNPKLYPLERYLDIADVALEKDPANLGKLLAAMKDPDLTVRYWGVVGCLLLKEQLGDDEKDKLLELLINDPSDVVRGMAAYALCEAGVSQEKALVCLKKLIEGGTYAMIEILNIVDWMGENGKPLVPTVAALEHGSPNVHKLQRTILEKFGVPLPDRLKPKKKHWKKKAKK